MSGPDPFGESNEWPAGLSVTKPLPAVKDAPQASKIATTSFPVTWVHDAELKLDSRPLLKGLIDAGGFIVIYGPSGSGKSFFTADLAQHIATGQPWRGRKVMQGLVVYIASEAGTSILKRFVGWRDNRVGEAAGRIPLAVLTRGPNLLNMVEIAHLVEQLKQLEIESGLPLVLVVFDTLSRSMPGAEENNTEDMTLAVNAADHIREKFNAGTIYVHHTGKDPSKGPRGNYSLYAAADLVMLVEDKCASVDKVRDGVSGERFPFTLEPVEIGIDADGDSVVTCLLNASDTSTPSRRLEPTGKNQRIVLKELRALSPNGQQCPGTSQIPKGVMLVKFEDLAEKAIPRFTGMASFKARGRVTEALTSLQATGFIGAQGELVWLL